MDTIDKINILLKERGMTGAELSREIGVSSAVYSQWNKRRTRPSNKSILKIADYFCVPVSELVGEVQKEKPPAQGEGPMYPEWYGKLTPEETEQVRKYAEFLIAERRKDQP